jgi:ubiquinone/menaquinone biosynthesis C-methylase UbiE
MTSGQRAGTETGVRRLNWGCGGYPAEGWINSDKGDYEGVQLVCDILEGLPLEDDSIDYAVSIHALPEIPYPQVVPVLQELRRVLKPGGVLRLCLPDLDKGIRAYLDGNRGYFLVPDDDARTISGKLITQVVWYGYSRTPFTHDWIEELLLKAGFSRVDHVAFGKTASPFGEIVGLDSRERESLLVEAEK